MSDNETEETTVSTEQSGSEKETAGQKAGAEASVSATDLSKLMSSGDTSGAGTAQRPDLDAEAMVAAQAAIAEGERAVVTAQAQLGSDTKTKRAASNRRELVLRLILAVNVLAMLVVAVLPYDSLGTVVPETGSGSESVTGQPTGPQAPAPGPRIAEKYNQALIASENREFARAVTLLEEYLVESPNMQASRKVNVYRAMAHYSSMIGRFREAQGYERRAQAETQSHSLPEDLIAMANAAVESGDQESLRQVWARFLLQQRQIPSSLYQYVAEAYLQLGDSYRVQANQAAEAARLAELSQAEALLREQGKKR